MNSVCFAVPLSGEGFESFQLRELQSAQFCLGNRH